jgi:hypothetical protein
MARINGVQQADAGLKVKLVYWFMRKGMAKLTGRAPAADRSGSTPPSGSARPGLARVWCACRPTAPPSTHAGADRLETIPPRRRRIRETQLHHTASLIADTAQPDNRTRRPRPAGP